MCYKCDKVMGRASHLRVASSACGQSRPSLKSRNHKITQSQGVGVALFLVINVIKCDKCDWALRGGTGRNKEIKEVKEIKDSSLNSLTALPP